MPRPDRSTYPLRIAGTPTFLKPRTVRPTPSPVGASRALHGLLRAAFAIAVLAVVTATLVAADADLTFAAIVLLLVVVGAATLGFAPGVVAAVLAAGALTYWFTPPYHSFSIDQADDVLALVAFVAVSAAVAGTVAYLNRLRRRAELGAREARLRVEFTNSLAGGAPTERVLRELADGLVELFESRGVHHRGGRRRLRPPATSTTAWTTST